MSRINIWIVLLLVSVLANGVLIGAGARSWFAPPGPSLSEQAGEGRSRGFDIRAFVQALPEERRPEARRRAMAERRALEQELRAAGQARLRAYRALNADPFDPQVAADALAEARAARTAIEVRTEAIILDLAAELSPEERQAALRAALGPPRMPRRDRGAPPPHGDRR